MFCYNHFFGAYRNMYLDYDCLHTADDHDELPIRFTRLNGSCEPDTAKTVAPACESWDVHGFTSEELDHLKTFLSDNMASLLAEAELTRDEDTHMTTMTIDMPDAELSLLLCVSYLNGIAPGEFVKNAIRSVYHAIEAGEIDPADYVDENGNLP